MRVGVTLPTFSPDAAGVLEAARAAERVGLHGVFCFDHQWPLGHPARPSLSIYPVLGAVGGVTERVHVGTLVGRVGLLPDAVVAESLESLHLVLGKRLIAGLGTGDEASEPEHERYGLPYFGVAARLGSLEGMLRRLAARGIECWVGAGRPVTNDVARRCGVTLNLWGATPERVERTRARLGIPVSWAGPFPKNPTEAAVSLRALEAAGATWVVWAWPSSLDLVCEAAAAAGVALSG